MEAAARKTEGVKDCTVNFMMQKMIVEFADGVDRNTVMENVRRSCKRVESDCEVFI